MGGGVGPKGGGVADEDLQAKCEELKSRNEAERQKFIDKMEKKRKREGLTNQEKADLRKAKRGGMTFSSAQSTCGGQTTTSTASSSGLANSQITSGGPGGTSAQKVGQPKRVRESKAQRYEARKKRSGTLCDGSYVHPGGGKGAHAEPKIMNDLTNNVGAGNMGGCSVLLNIDWRRNTPGGGVSPSGMPCEDCAAMLCHAKDPCKINIMICDQNNQPTPLSDSDCAGDDGYEDLSRRVDGGFPPGR